MKKLIIGNWKMHLNRQEAVSLASELAANAAEHNLAQVEMVVCPPALWLVDVGKAIENKPVKLGAQDCRAEVEGAFTGDISAAMLHDAGASYVLVGHSERRKYHNESNDLVKDKALSVQENGMIPVICIGETEEERQSNRFEAVIAQQLDESIPENGEYVVAYEPVWAIGTGKTASLDDIRAMHRFIRDWLNGNRVDQNGQVCILYGGSVKAANAREILSVENVNGVLVGGASLDAKEFGAIAQSA